MTLLEIRAGLNILALLLYIAAVAVAWRSEGRLKPALSLFLAGTVLALVATLLWLLQL